MAVPHARKALARDLCCGEGPWGFRAQSRRAARFRQVLASEVTQDRGQARQRQSLTAARDVALILEGAWLSVGQVRQLSISIEKVESTEAKERIDLDLLTETLDQFCRCGLYNVQGIHRAWCRADARLATWFVATVFFVALAAVAVGMSVAQRDLTLGAVVVCAAIAGSVVGVALVMEFQRVRTTLAWIAYILENSAAQKKGQAPHGQR